MASGSRRIHCHIRNHSYLFEASHSIPGTYIQHIDLKGYHMSGLEHSECNLPSPAQEGTQNIASSVLAVAMYLATPLTYNHEE